MVCSGKRREKLDFLAFPLWKDETKGNERRERARKRWTTKERILVVRRRLFLGGTVETGRGVSVHSAAVLVENGKVREILPAEEAAARFPDVPAEGGSDIWITPGLIDAHTHLGVYCEGFPEDMEDANDMTDPVLPHLRILDAIYPGDTGFDDALAGGVTCVQVLPGSGNVLGGQGAVIKTRRDVTDRMVVRAPSSMKAALGENPIRIYKSKGKLPNTRMGNAALLRNSFVEALNYRLKLEKAAAKGESDERNLAREALLPVLDGELPLCVHAHRADDIVTALRIAKEFDLRITLEHCTEGHLIAPFLAEQRARAAVGPTLTGKPKIELRFKTWDTPFALHRAGVHFCIITDHPVVPIEHLSVCAALAVRAGLPREEALRAVTLSAAEHLDLAERLGSLDPGKDADLALWDGDPLDARSRVVTTVIDGEPVWRRG